MPSLAIYNEFERDDYGNIIDPRAFYGMYIPNGCDFGGKDLNSDNVNAPVIWIGRISRKLQARLWTATVSLL